MTTLYGVMLHTCDRLKWIHLDFRRGLIKRPAGGGVEHCMQERDLDVVEQQRSHVCEEGPQGQRVGGAEVHHQQEVGELLVDVL